MSGRGKGGKGLGKGGAKRHRKILRDNIQGVTKPAIRRLARRGGVKRISGLIYEEVRGVLKAFLETIIRDSVTYTEHAKRKTVTALDVVYALKRNGHTLYGFGTGPKPKPREYKCICGKTFKEKSSLASHKNECQIVAQKKTTATPKATTPKAATPKSNVSKKDQLSTLWRTSLYEIMDNKKTTRPDLILESTEEAKKHWGEKMKLVNLHRVLRGGKKTQATKYFATKNRLTNNKAAFMKKLSTYKISESDYKIITVNQKMFHDMFDLNNLSINDKHKRMLVIQNKINTNICNKKGTSKDEMNRVLAEEYLSVLTNIQMDSEDNVIELKHKFKDEDFVFKIAVHKSNLEKYEELVKKGAINNMNDVNNLLDLIESILLVIFLNTTTKSNIIYSNDFNTLLKKHDIDPTTSIFLASVCAQVLN